MKKIIALLILTLSLNSSAIDVAPVGAPGSPPGGGGGGDHNTLINVTPSQHHVKTVSGDIDHDSILNVSTSDHHVKTVSGDIDHGSIIGLGDDDHSQYHNNTRGDARYFQESEHLNVSAGAGDAGKPVILDAAGHIDATMINDADVSITHAATTGQTASDHHAKTVSGDIDHGSILGLGDDDHSQYHNDTRGDARYYQESEHLNVSAGAGDAGKPIVLDAAGHIDATMINDADVSIAHSATTGQTASDHHAKTVSGDIDHDSITGVSADDHHAEAHSIASHNDTTATGAELETLTNASNADTLHSHTLTTDTFAIIEAAGVPVSTSFPTLNYSTSDFLLTESPADDFAITIVDGGISHDSIADVSADDHHAEVHTIVSHDTTATGANLNTLTGAGNADALHVHAHSATTGQGPNDHHTPTVDTQRPYQPVFSIYGPFSTTISDIDGQRGFDGGQTFTDAVISIGNNAVSASTVLTINRNGASGSASVTATFTPATGNTTQDIALSGSLVVADGDFIWVDITTIPGSMDSLSVRVK